VIARGRSFLISTKAHTCLLRHSQPQPHPHPHPHTSTTSLDTKIHSAFLRMRADCLPHASVIVSVNDKILTEHSTENDALSVTTFVEAVAGAHFAVVLQLHDAFAYRHPSDRIHFAVHLDGEYAAAYIVNPSTQSPVKSTINSTVETIHNQTTRRNFIFASHETSTLLSRRLHCGLHANICCSGGPGPCASCR
jgi:hypothetical protein